MRHLKVTVYLLLAPVFWIYRLYVRSITLRKINLILRQLKDSTQPINVYFQLVDLSLFKYDRLYRIFENDKLFNPLIVVCPRTGNIADVHSDYEKCIDYCISAGLKYIPTIHSGVSITLKELNLLEAPSIVFLQNSWDITDYKYKIRQWKNSLPCYSSYFFTLNTLYSHNYNKVFHLRLWKHFLETPQHLADANRYDTSAFSQRIVTGYPGLDRFMAARPTHDPWQHKDKDNVLKRIIYAPHHTISSSDANLSYSTFEKTGSYILDIAHEYKDQCVFCFKPHPFLFKKLCANKDWGPEKTKAYWSAWENAPNTFVCDGDYEQLFLWSDALIHDCNSFLAEYLITGKQSLFLLHDDLVKTRLNTTGQMLLNAHYQARTKADIIEFINQILTDSQDPLKYRRTSAAKSIYANPDLLPSQSIYTHIVRELKRG